MKKLIFLLAFITLVASVDAQWAKLSTGKYKYTGQAADTCNGSNVKNIVLLGVPQGRPYFLQVSATIDEFNGSATAWAILEGSLDGTNYYLVDTLTTTPTSGTEAVTADGTVIYSDFSTGSVWPYLRVQLKLSTTGRWNFDYIYTQIVGKND
jgi:hypothetical protein